jgi:hypothetical protein
MYPSLLAYIRRALIVTGITYQNWSRSLSRATLFWCEVAGVKAEFPVSALVRNNGKRFVSLCSVGALRLLCCCTHQQVSELVAYRPRKGNKLQFLELCCGLKIATLLREEQMLYFALKFRSNSRIHWILCKKVRKSSCETDAQYAASGLSVNLKRQIHIITTMPTDCIVSWLITTQSKFLLYCFPSRTKRRCW